MPSRVTDTMNADLMQECMEEEVKCALDSMGDLKALSPNGMPVQEVPGYSGEECVQGDCNPSEWRNNG